MARVIWFSRDGYHEVFIRDVVPDVYGVRWRLLHQRQCRHLLR